MSIGAGGGAQTAGVAIAGRLTFIATPPDSVRLAPPTTSALSGPGEPVGVGEGVADRAVAAGRRDGRGP